MKRVNVSEISSGPSNSDHSTNSSKVPRKVSESTVEREISQNSSERINEISGVEKLPDLAKKHIFRYLPLQDLKKLTVTSSKLNWDVKTLDRRFSVVSARLDEDLPVLEHLTVKRRNTQICLRVQCSEDISKDKLEEKFLWIRTQSDKITHLAIDVGTYDRNLNDCHIEIVRRLLSSDLQFPVLKKVELRLDFMTPDTFHNLLIKFESKIEVLKLSRMDFRNFDVPDRYKLTSLKEVAFDCLKGISNPFKILQSAIHYIEVLRFDGFDTMTMPFIEQDLPRLRKLEIHADTDLVINLENFLKKCAKTLTHLHMYGEYTDDPQLMSINFSALQSAFFDFNDMVMKSSLMKNLLYQSAQTLQFLKLELSDIEYDIDLGINFSVLTKIAIVLYDGSDISGMLVEVMRRAPNLETFMHSSGDFEFDGFDQVEHQFPAMKHVCIWSRDYDARVQCGTGLNSFLKKCPNLETLDLFGLQVNLNIELPRLTTLIAHVRGSGFDKLLSSCASSLEELNMNIANIPVLASVCEKGLPNLKSLQLHPSVPAWFRVEGMNLPKNVEVCENYIDGWDWMYDDW